MAEVEPDPGVKYFGGLPWLKGKDASSGDENESRIYSEHAELKGDPILVHENATSVPYHENRAVEVEHVAVDTTGVSNMEHMGGTDPTASETSTSVLPDHQDIEIEEEIEIIDLLSAKAAKEFDGGRYDAAEKILTKSLRRCQKLLRQTPPVRLSQLPKIVLNMARALEKQEKHEEARKCIRDGSEVYGLNEKQSQHVDACFTRHKDYEEIPTPAKAKPAMATAPEFLKFRDAVNRKFQFPFRLCNTWQGMECLIHQAFLHVDDIGPHVREGHYDLHGPGGQIILPSTWDQTVQPNWSISMVMWPLPDSPPPLPSPPPETVIVEPPSTESQNARMNNVTTTATTTKIKPKLRPQSRASELNPLLMWTAGRGSLKQKPRR